MDVIEIKIPFTEEELDKYFDAIEDYIFIVNVDESEYQGKALLNYIYNTSMQCDMKIKDYNENISNLLIEYIQTDKLLSIPALNILWIDILKNLIDGALPDENEQYKKFIVSFKDKHIDLVNELACILSSLKIFLMNVLVEEDIKAEDREIENIGNNDGYKVSYYFYSEFSPLSIIKICTDLFDKEQ